VLDGLPADQRVGLFAAPRTYQAWIRFANASTSSDRERDTRGMAIKVLGVGATNLTPGATSQDFILNSHPVMMVPGTREFLELLEANEAGGFRRALYFLSHPKAARIAFASRANPTCHLDIPYWSTTPYRFGTAGAVKYIAVPAPGAKSPMPGTLTDTYLRDALQSRLAQGDATFDFMIQRQTDARRMPIEDASVEWKAEDSPYLRVARIRIPKQPVTDEARAARCEQVAFNPWNCLAEHQPLGSMNRARREIYRAMAAFRGAAAPV
jgi:catalase